MNETQLKLTDDENEFFKELVDNEFKIKTAEILGNPVENYNGVNLSSLTVDELKRLLSKHLEDTKNEYNKLLDSYKTMKPGEDGWYYMGYVEDEYEILEPYAEKAGMLKEFKEVYDKFWPLEHMTYEDVQVKRQRSRIMNLPKQITLKDGIFITDLN